MEKICNPFFLLSLRIFERFVQFAILSTSSRFSERIVLYLFFKLIQVSQVQKFLGSSLIGIRPYSALHIAKK